MSEVQVEAVKILTGTQKWSVLRLACDANAGHILPPDFASNPQSFFGATNGLFTHGTKVHFIAYCDHRVLGQVIIGYGCGVVAASCLDNHNVMYLQCLIVKKKYQKNGVGTLLVQCMQTRIEEVILEAYDLSLIQFWCKQGFESMSPSAYSSRLTTDRMLLWYNKEKVNVDDTIKGVWISVEK
jgi:GNAT superfamily N-acetyltransferase